jgi:hypothetical protein
VKPVQALTLVPDCAKSPTAQLVNQVKQKGKHSMFEIVTSYWLAVVSTALTGLFLIGVLKKARDEKARQEKAPAPIAIRRKR